MAYSLKMLVRVRAMRASKLQLHCEITHVSGERALDLIAQKYRTLDIRAGVHVAHPRLHDVDAEIVFSRVIKVVAHIQGYVFVNLVLKPGE